MICLLIYISDVAITFPSGLSITIEQLMECMFQIWQYFRVKINLMADKMETELLLRVCVNWLWAILRLLLKLPRMTAVCIGVISVHRRKNQAVD